MSDPIRSAWEEHQAVARAMEPQLLTHIKAAADAIRAALAGGGQVLIFGNGGSAADAQHFAAELVGRYVRQRRALRAVALTTDTSALTAIGNDYGFEEIFARQVAALARRGDVAVGISTSGNSANVIRGLAAARQIGAATVALTGGDGGKIKAEAHHVLIVPSSVTARIQEMHSLIIHMICDCVDRWAVDG